MLESRYISNIIKELCFTGPQKMALVVGPRQSGKTTLSKYLLKQRGEGAYYNWDQREFRSLWARTPQKIITDLPDNQKTPPILVLDEIHKAKLWKRTLKGIFDTLEHRVDIVVTGSARLDTYKKGSDSLLGRYFYFRLHPFSVAEMLGKTPPDPDGVIEALRKDAPLPSREAIEALNNLITFGGFPEPLFSQSERRARAWRQLRLQQLVREDLRDLSKLSELGNVELLLALLPERAGSQLSRSALREDLEVAYSTVSRWLEYLSALFYHFEVRPFSKSIKRGIKKEGKLFLWDYAEVPERGHRFENLVAHHLLKACHYWSDAGYGSFNLSYLRDANGAEIDLLIVRDGKPWLPVEVKLNETTPSSAWKVFLPQISSSMGIQVVLTPHHYYKAHVVGDKNVIVIDAASFLSMGV